MLWGPVVIPIAHTEGGEMNKSAAAEVGMRKSRRT